MRTIKLTLAYDGTAYAGWQFQPDHPTVQGAIEAVIHRITGETLRITGSGRTDSGVHAHGQVASFNTQCKLEPHVFQRALNAFLPADIVVLQVEEAPLGFHAIRNSIRKRYRYVIDDGPLPDPFARAHSWRSWHRLDADAMAKAGALLLGTHDFRSFETSGSPRISTIRTIYELTVERLPAELKGHIQIEVEADGFLYNMVRTIAGSLMLVGKGDKPQQWMSDVLAACDRRAAGPTAPPQGLFLMRVEYAPQGSPDSACDADEQPDEAELNKRQASI